MNARQMLGALLVTGLMAATANADPWQRNGEINSRDATAEQIVIGDATYRLPAYVQVTGGVSQQDLLPGRHVGFDVADSDPNVIEALWLLADAPPRSPE